MTRISVLSVHGRVPANSTHTFQKSLQTQKVLLMRLCVFSGLPGQHAVVGLIHIHPAIPCCNAETLSSLQQMQGAQARFAPQFSNRFPPPATSTGASGMLAPRPLPPPMASTQRPRPALPGGITPKASVAAGVCVMCHGHACVARASSHLCTMLCRRGSRFTANLPHKRGQLASIDVTCFVCTSCRCVCGGCA